MLFNNRFIYKKEEVPMPNLSNMKGSFMDSVLGYGGNEAPKEPERSQSEAETKEQMAALRAQIEEEYRVRKEKERAVAASSITTGQNTQNPTDKKEATPVSPSKTVSRRFGRRKKDKASQGESVAPKGEPVAPQKKIVGEVKPVESDKKTPETGLNESRKGKKELERVAGQLSQSISSLGNEQLRGMKVSRDKLNYGWEKLRKRGRFTDGFKWHEWNPFTNHNMYESKTWAAKIYKECEAAWEKAKESGDDKDRKKAAELFVRLKNSIDDYYNQTEKVVKSLESKYKVRISSLAELYDLPDDINAADLSPSQTTVKLSGPAYSSSGVEDNSQFVAQRGEIEIESLRTPLEIDKFFKDYFKKRPTYIFSGTDSSNRDPWGQLTASLKVSPEKLKESNYFIGMKPKAIFNVVNQMILLRNMYSVGDLVASIQSAHSKELGAALGRINSSVKPYYEHKDKTDMTEYFLTGKSVKKK